MCEVLADQLALVKGRYSRPIERLLSCVDMFEHLYQALAKLIETAIAMNFDRSDYKREQWMCLGFITFLMLYYTALLTISFYAGVRTETCVKPAGEGREFVCYIQK
ncbi:unnamed protein product [Strongylus vulgaris]|uniref:Uncharacterized protein n=1 Tax=Strongylus vulgaris TaxID=40348 RepID=A0A3P7J7H0_STRVU|nr:unnamed protein product [Strongylus vulgaris]